jgi:hypothetical protein
MRSALPALTTKEDVRKHGEQVIPLKLITTAHTVGAFLHNAFTLRDSVYTDIEKAAYYNTI